MTYNQLKKQAKKKVQYFDKEDIVLTLFAFYNASLLPYEKKKRYDKMRKSKKSIDAAIDYIMIFNDMTSEVSGMRNRALIEALQERLEELS